MTIPQLGRIRAVTIVCPTLDAAVDAYREYLDYRVIERGVVPAVLAAAWAAPAVVDRRYVVLGPASGADTYLRFVEIPESPAYAPYSAYGWNAIELTVQDCDAAVAKLARGPFQVVGQPHDLGFSNGALRAGQLQGPVGEILYLTEVRRPMPGFELPSARSLIDRVFIVVLHGSSAEYGISDYRARFGNEGSGAFDVTVDFMAEFQGLDRQHTYRIGTLSLAPGFYLEFDGSPAHIGARVTPDASLPPGIAMVTLETAARTGAAGNWPSGPVYESRAVTRTAGPFGEWLELIGSPG